jgi:cold shock CspA family protein
MREKEKGEKDMFTKKELAAMTEVQRAKATDLIRRRNEVTKARRTLDEFKKVMAKIAEAEEKGPKAANLKPVG